MIFAHIGTVTCSSIRAHFFALFGGIISVERSTVCDACVIIPVAVVVIRALSYTRHGKRISKIAIRTICQTYSILLIFKLIFWAVLCAVEVSGAVNSIVRFRADINTKTSCIVGKETIEALRTTEKSVIHSKVHRISCASFHAPAVNWVGNCVILAIMGRGASSGHWICKARLRAGKNTLLSIDICIVVRIFRTLLHAKPGSIVGIVTPMVITSFLACVRPLIAKIISRTIFHTGSVDRLGKGSIRALLHTIPSTIIGKCALSAEVGALSSFIISVLIP